MTRYIMSLTAEKDDSMKYIILAAVIALVAYLAYLGIKQTVFEIIDFKRAFHVIVLITDIAIIPKQCKLLRNWNL